MSKFDDEFENHVKFNLSEETILTTLFDSFIYMVRLLEASRKISLIERRQILDEVNFYIKNYMDELFKKHFGGC